MQVLLQADNSSQYCSVVLLTVRDAGPGISQDDQARLFKITVPRRPEDQLQRGTGSGLGLIIAKRIVELHGGRIGVTSSKGQGSLFYFSIPFQQVRSGQVGWGLI